MIIGKLEIKNKCQNLLLFNKRTNYDKYKVKKYLPVTLACHLSII